jgi:hypothetical protein
LRSSARDTPGPAADAQQERLHAVSHGERAIDVEGRHGARSIGGHRRLSIIDQKSGQLLLTTSGSSTMMPLDPSRPTRTPSPAGGRDGCPAWRVCGLGSTIRPSGLSTASTPRLAQLVAQIGEPVALLVADEADTRDVGAAVGEHRHHRQRGHQITEVDHVDGDAVEGAVRD